MVMVVLGTKPEHFSSPWVRNEWSRYRTLLIKGENKTIIPAYRGMSPYDLPRGFAHLQALDMSKLGFVQDLCDALPIPAPARQFVQALVPTGRQVYQCEWFTISALKSFIT